MRWLVFSIRFISNFLPTTTAKLLATEKKLLLLFSFKMRCKLLIIVTTLIPFWFIFRVSFATKELEQQIGFKKPASSFPQNFVGGKRSSSSINQVEPDNYDDDYYINPFDIGTEDDEDRCPEEMYWHARSFKCVPFLCPGGNQFRNKHSGDCLLKHYPSLIKFSDDLEERPVRGQR